MNHREHRAALLAKRTSPDLIAVSEAEHRELMAIVDGHNEEYDAGLDKVDPQWVTPADPEYMDPRNAAFWERFE